MSGLRPEFKVLCPELEAAERAAVEGYMDRHVDQGMGRGYDNYIYRLYWLARVSGAERVVELGCTPGGSTLAFAFAARRAGGTLWSCDIGPVRESTVTEWGLTLDGWNWQRVSGKRADEFGAEWSGAPVDLVYLDTSHTYEDTIKEFDAWLPHLREGGLFVFHDVEACRGTVLRAVLDSVLKRGVTVEYHHFPDCHGHGVLQWFSNHRFNFGSAEDGGLTSLTSALILAGTGP